jgi:hypothetical protein
MSWGAAIIIVMVGLAASLLCGSRASPTSGAIHLFTTGNEKDVDARHIGVRSTPSFERLWPGMTREGQP